MSWEKSEVDGTIGILHTGFVHTVWALSLRQLIIPKVKYSLVSGVPYDIARNLIAEQFLKDGGDWLFFLDSDVVLQPNDLIHLLRISEERKLAVVAALYWRRTPPIEPAMWVYADESKSKYISVYPYECKTCGARLVNEFIASEHRKLGHKVVRKWEPGEILLVDAVHMGATLIKRWVLEELKIKNPDKPFFYYTAKKYGYEDGSSEDFYFCKRIIEEIGIRPAVATNVVAKHISHVFIDGYTGEIDFMEV